MEEMSKAPAQPNQSLQNGIECLLELADSGRPVGCRELARKLDLSATRVSRLLGTLASLGLATKTPARKYTPGPGIHVLTAMSLRGSHLLTSALPHLHRLSQKTGMSVALGTLWRTKVCYLYHGTPGQNAEAAIAGHGLCPAVQSSIGRILLAARRPEELTALYPDDETLSSLRAQLSQVTEQGYALETPAGNSIAIALGTPPVAGLALAGHVDKTEIPNLLRNLTQTARDILADLQAPKS
jgi:DNA-binding IclR family transcriptional regulator